MGDCQVVFDVTIIGAGVAGLTAAQQLQQAGYSVVVVDKSRGVGGRAATRRVNGTRADHGLRYLEPDGEILPRLVEKLRDRHILQVWIDNRYIAPDGMSAIGKFLASGLEVKLDRRVEAITLTSENSWQLSFENNPDAIAAKAVVMAIPAPQALAILSPLGENVLSGEFLDKLRSVEFDPCLTVMAGYGDRKELNLDWKDTTFSPNSDLAWIGLDSSKRPNAEFPLFVMHSSAEFAKNYIDAADLNTVARQLLATAAAELNISWLSAPEWFQIHRWRYAFPSYALQENYLEAKSSLPLICCGDWCGGNLVESALNSGLAAADRINRYIKNVSLPGIGFLDIF